MTALVEVRAPRHEEMRQVLKLRYQVLDAPVGRPEKTIVGEADKHPLTINRVVVVKGKIVATVRFEPYEDGNYLVRRMATHPDVRGQGYGRQVLEAAESVAFERGARKITLYAREGAIGFYAKMGYTTTGKFAYHHGDKNTEMIKRHNSEESA